MPSSTSDRFRWPKAVQSVHWSIATLFLSNQFFIEGGEELHEYFGWSILALIVFRLIYGFFLAPAPARLSDLKTSSTGIKTHLKELKDGNPVIHRGHNPLGVIAVWLMWFSLAAAVFTGWLQDTDFGYDYAVFEWHHWLVDGLLVLTALHLMAITLTSWRIRNNLLKTML